MRAKPCARGKVMPLTAILDIVAKRQPGTVIAKWTWSSEHRLTA